MSTVKTDTNPFIRRILLHGKNSQKRDNIKKKDNKTTNNLTYVHK